MTALRYRLDIFNKMTHTDFISCWCMCVVIAFDNRIESIKI